MSYNITLSHAEMVLVIYALHGFAEKLEFEGINDTRPDQCRELAETLRVTR